MGGQRALGEVDGQTDLQPKNTERFHFWRVNWNGPAMSGRFKESPLCKTASFLA